MADSYIPPILRRKQEEQEGYTGGYVPPILANKRQEDDDRLSFTKKEVANDPVRSSWLRKYMTNRFGVQWEDRGNEEIVDAYITHMRGVNTNELRTIGEARYIQSVPEEEKQSAANAYAIYEELAPFWSSGEGIGDITGAVKDYGLAVLTSPSTYLGGVFGKVAGRGATFYYVCC